MSNERSSSAVRNLRSIFENKGSESQNTEVKQQAISSRAASREGRSRPLSKVRSSFVAVDKYNMASTAADQPDGAALERVSSASLRRQSFSENDENRESLEAFKKSVNQESERRGRESGVQETIPEVAVESAANTPALELKESQAFGLTPRATSKLSAVSTLDSTQPPDNPDKATTGAQEEPGQLKPAEPTNVAAVSAAVATSTQELDGDIVEQKASSVRSNGTKQISRPSNIMPKTKAAKPGIESPKSPASAKSAASSLAQSTKAIVKDLSRKVSRSSLTAPTAASSARATGMDKQESSASSKSPPPAKRETTKIANISAHLLAPTAASRAKREPGAQFKSTADNHTAKITGKTNTARSTPRTSLAAHTRPDSRSSQGPRKPVAIPDSGFLDRMMRPTAASQNRSSEKVENKPLPKRHVPMPKKTIKSTNAQSVATHGEILHVEKDTPTTAANDETNHSMAKDVSPAIEETAKPVAVPTSTANAADLDTTTEDVPGEDSRGDVPST